MKKIITLVLLLSIVGLITAATVRRPVFVADANTQILAGTVTAATDGKLTNAFATAFSAAPLLICSQIGNACSPTNLLVVTATNFIWTTAQNGQVANWIAVGIP